MSRFKDLCAVFTKWLVGILLIVAAILFSFDCLTLDDKPVKHELSLNFWHSKTENNDEKHYLCFYRIGWICILLGGAGTLIFNYLDYIQRQTFKSLSEELDKTKKDLFSCEGFRENTSKCERQSESAARGREKVQRRVERVSTL